MSMTRPVVLLLAGFLLAGCQQQQNQQHAERNEFYRDARTAAVIVQESYGAHAGIALPFRRVAAEWLRIAGVEVVDDAAAADVVITIEARGEPLKRRYGASGDLFTGARLSGSIRIERPSRHRDEVLFSRVVDPPVRFSGRGTVDYRLPGHAPFMNALPEEGASSSAAARTAFDGFASGFAGLMGRYFGRSVLLIALDDHHSKGALRDSAVDALAEPGKPAIPYLVDAFLYCSPEAEKGVGEALERITGEKFGTDVRAWTDWYGRQERR